jgi:hypothetical protein
MLCKIARCCFSLALIVFMGYSFSGHLVLGALAHFISVAVYIAPVA